MTTTPRLVYTPRQLGAGNWHPPILNDVLAGPAVWHLAVDLATFPARWVRRVLGGGQR